MIIINSTVCFVHYMIYILHLIMCTKIGRHIVCWINIMNIIEIYFFAMSYNYVKLQAYRSLYPGILFSMMERGCMFKSNHHKLSRYHDSDWKINNWFKHTLDSLSRYILFNIEGDLSLSWICGFVQSFIIAISLRKYSKPDTKQNKKFHWFLLFCQDWFESKGNIEAIMYRWII